MKKIVHLPLDERPCTYGYPKLLADMASQDVEFVTIPQNLLGKQKQPAKHENISAFLKKECKNADYLIIAIDTLLYGGILPSRLHYLKEDEIVSRIMELKELKKEKLILRSIHSGTRELFEKHLDSNNESIHSFDIILEVDNIALIKNLVRNNYGVSILAKSTCDYDVSRDHFKVIPIENLSMIRELNIIYHKDFSHVEILDDIVQIYNDSKKEK